MKHIIIKGIGPDRPGIVSSISGFVTSIGGNIEESRMIRLGSEFSIIMMVAIQEDMLGTLKDSLDGIDGIKFYITETKKIHTLASPTHILNLTGGDTEGIVHKMTDVLMSMGVNIIEVNTDTENAPVTGTIVFKMAVRLDIGSCDENKLSIELARLESKLGLSIALDRI